MIFFSFVKFSVPLCYVYPAMLHYKACAKTRRQKLADIALIVFGLIAAVYTSSQTLKVRRRVALLLSAIDGLLFTPLSF